MRLVLASTSPRRQELLSSLCPDFDLDAPRCDEALPDSTPPKRAVELLALRKAGEVFARRPGDAVIGSDTVVALEGRILGKPRDRAEALSMLVALSGREHWVHTGVAVLLPGGEHSFVTSARVVFSPMTTAECHAYAATGECDDKAGAYAVQGLGARFIERVEGDYYAVMGLPICPLYRLLHDLGLVSTEMSRKERNFSCYQP